MEDELEAVLRSEFPILKKADISIDNGWYIPVYLMCLKITSINPKIRISQIKEKFGELRVYYHPVNTEIDVIVDTTVTICHTICERCGDAGEIRNERDWVKTLCTKHNT